MKMISRLRNSRDAPAVRAAAKHAFLALTVAITVGQALQYCEDYLPEAFLALFPGRLSLSSLGFGVIVVASVARAAIPPRWIGTVLSVVAGMALGVLLPGWLRSDPAPGSRDRPTWNYEGDRARVKEPAPRTESPGNQFQASFEIHNTGALVWQDRRFCRSDGLNGRDYLRTRQCVKIAPVPPGGSVVVKVPVTVPAHEGDLRAEFKLADPDGIWYFDGPPAVLQVRSRD